jgi:putative endonuclease
MILKEELEHYFASADNIAEASKGTCFTGKYNCHNLVYYESYASIKNAIAREKELKNWRRKWKDELISGINPGWQSLNYEFFDKWPPERV